MRSHVRVSLLALVVSACVAVAAPVAQAAVPFGVEKVTASNCSTGHEGCYGEAVVIGPFEYWVPKEPNLAEAKNRATPRPLDIPHSESPHFKVNTEGEFPNEVPAGIATTGPVNHIRTDVGPGVSTNPEAVEKCTMEQFGEHEAVPGTRLLCGTGVRQIGTQKHGHRRQQGDCLCGRPKVLRPGSRISPWKALRTIWYSPKVGPPISVSRSNSRFLLPEPQLEKGFEAAEKEGAAPGVEGFPSLPAQHF